MIIDVFFIWGVVKVCVCVLSQGGQAFQFLEKLKEVSFSQMPNRGLIVLDAILGLRQLFLKLSWDLG